MADDETIIVHDSGSHMDINQATGMDGYQASTGMHAFPS